MGQNKLECLSLEGLSSLVKYLRERPRSYSLGQAPGLIANNRQGWKGLSGTNHYSFYLFKIKMDA